jgi:hypothetical protein
MRVKKHKKISSNLPLYTLLAFVAVLIYVNYFFLQNKSQPSYNGALNTASEILPSPIPISTFLPEIASLPITPNHSHMAFLKANGTSYQEIWLYDFITRKQYKVFPGIETSKFCGEGCASRAFSFSGDKTKLAADLLINANQKGFGYIDLLDKNGKIHYLHSGYHPSWSPDDKYILFNDGYFGTIKASVLNIINNSVISFDSNYRSGDWISNTEVILYKNELEEAGVFYIGNILNGGIRKIVVPELASQNRLISKIFISPSKKKLFIASRLRGVNEIGVVGTDGTQFKSLSAGEVGEAAEYYGVAWSLDEKRLALNIWPAYQTIGRDITILNIDGKVEKQIREDTDADSSLCWTQNKSGQNIVVVGTSDKESAIHLYDLNTDKVDSLSTSAEKIGSSSEFICN